MQEVLQLKFTPVGSRVGAKGHFGFCTESCIYGILQAADTDDDSLFKAMFKPGY